MYVENKAPTFQLAPCVAFYFLRFCIKQNGNGGSLVQFTFHGDLSVVILHGVLHDGQSKTGATGLLGVALIHTIEAFKHLLLMFGRNTDAGILHAQQNFTVLLSNGYFHAAAGIVVFDGIITKIVNHLL